MRSRTIWVDRGFASEHVDSDRGFELSENRRAFDRDAAAMAKNDEQGGLAPISRPISERGTRRNRHLEKVDTLGLARTSGCVNSRMVLSETTVMMDVCQLSAARSTTSRVRRCRCKELREQQWRDDYWGDTIQRTHQEGCRGGTGVGVVLATPLSLTSLLTCTERKRKETIHARTRPSAMGGRPCLVG